MKINRCDNCKQRPKVFTYIDHTHNAGHHDICYFKLSCYCDARKTPVYSMDRSLDIDPFGVERLIEQWNTNHPDDQDKEVDLSCLYGSDVLFHHGDYYSKITDEHYPQSRLPVCDLWQANPDGIPPLIPEGLDVEYRYDGDEKVTMFRINGLKEGWRWP